jgi:hypothetical protein
VGRRSAGHPGGARLSTGARHCGRRGRGSTGWSDHWGARRAGWGGHGGVDPARYRRRTHYRGLSGGRSAAACGFRGWQRRDRGEGARREEGGLGFHVMIQWLLLIARISNIGRWVEKNFRKVYRIPGLRRRCGSAGLPDGEGITYMPLRKLSVMHMP